MHVNQRPAVLMVELNGAKLQTSVQVQFRFIPSNAQGLQYLMAMVEGASKSYFLHSPAVKGDNSTSNGTITFSPGVRQQTIIIPSIYLKLSRTFTVLLSGAPTRVTLSPSQATVTITEDNGRWDIIVVVCML